jgi:RHS repeat-associated protein
VLATKNVPLIQAAAMPAVSGAQQGAIDYKYNSAGLLSEGGDSSARYTWAYDQLNRQTSETADLDPANPLNSIVSLTQAFNVAGKRTQLSARFTDFGAGGTVTTRPDFRSVFEYDNLDRLKSIQQTALGGANSNAVAPKFASFSYNLLGQLTTLNRFESTTATGPALRTSWTYDGANRLSLLKHESASGATPTLLNQYSYTYDLMNRITGITSTLDGPSAFTYDTNSQLRGATHAAPRAPETYQYDNNGNRTGGAQQVGVNNQTLADDKYSYQYDAEGNRTRRTAKSASAPEPIEDFTWDHRNRLTKITFRSAAGVETRSIEYRYDLLNRLVLRRLDSNGAATAGGVSDIWLAGYDGINPTLALSSLSSTAITNRYLWGPGVDFLLADEQLTTTSAPGNTLWPLGDHLGTLRDLADFTGASFTITNHRVFDTFGRLLSESNAAVDTNFAFTGKFFDDLGDAENSTSLSHHWNRWYDPQTGKWMSEDPIGFAGGDANLGRYVGNFATGGRDWSGLFDDPWWRDSGWDFFQPWSWGGCFCEGSGVVAAADWVGRRSHPARGCIFNPKYRE